MSSSRSMCETRGAPGLATIAFGVIGAFVLGYTDSIAQSIVDIPDVVRCPTCTIALEEVVTLGTPDGPGMVESDNVSAVRDSQGRYYLHQNFGTAIVVYESDGSYLRTIGRRGGGPGEFSRISAVRVGPQDSLYVFDAEHLRITTYSPAHDLVATRRVPIPSGMNVVLLGDGSVVFASSIRTPELAGLPLHLITPDGALAKSFGSIRGEYRPDIPSIAARAVALDSDGNIVALHRAAYLIDTWTPEGLIKRRVARATDWFGPPTMRRTDMTKPPAPYPFAVWEDDQRRLWILMLVAGENWRQGVVEGDGLHDRVIDPDLYYDTYIEVIDPDMGGVLARHRVPDILTNFVDNSLVGAVVTDRHGIPYYRVWRLHLREEPGG